MPNEKTRERFWCQLLETAELFRDVGDRDMLKSASQITYSQGKILRLLFRHQPEGVRLSSIAEELGLTKGAVTQTVDSLREMGFVERKASETDRRSTLIQLSSAGKEIRRRHVRSYSRLLTECMQDIPAEEQAAFLEVLLALRQNLKRKKTQMQNDKKGKSRRQCR